MQNKEFETWDLGLGPSKLKLESWKWKKNLKLGIRMVLLLMGNRADQIIN